jgi:hypothetical protein
VRVPGGSTVRSSVTHSTELTALEAQLGHRYRHHVELVPSHGRTTARLILYADPRP